jgi:hypothetical protein
MTTAAQRPAEEKSVTSRRQVLLRQGRVLVGSIQEGDEYSMRKEEPR